MLIGYARVSTEDQKLRVQHDALSAAGCDKIFDEKISGAGAHLPGREELLEYTRPGDVVVVWKLDRLVRSLRSSERGHSAAKRTSSRHRFNHEDFCAGIPLRWAAR